MTSTTTNTLTDLAARLEQHLGSAASMGAVSTRLLLRTGINLRHPKPEQINDAALVARARNTLAEMGYRL